MQTPFTFIYPKNKKWSAFHEIFATETFSSHLNPLLSSNRIKEMRKIWEACCKKIINYWKN